MRFDSKHWNTQLGVCTLHGLPEVPCPACMTQPHPDLELVLSYLEAEAMLFGQDIDDLLPANLIGFRFAGIRQGT